MDKDYTEAEAVNGPGVLKETFNEKLQNAKRIYNTISRLLDNGCIVFDKNKEIVDELFQKGKGNKWEFGIEKWQFGSEYLNYKTIYFSKNFGVGVYESIDEFSAKFKDWTYVKQPPKKIF